MDFITILLILFLIFVVHRLITNYVPISGFQTDHPQRKTVLVSGCDTGFGYELALKLISKGIFTFAGCLTENGETELRKEAKKLKADQNLVTFNLNVTKQESCDAAVELVKKTLKGTQVLWGLVNNAGVPSSGPDDWMTIQDYQKVLDVNCLGVIRLSHSFLPMLKSSKGRIVTITSMTSRLPHAFCGGYALSKCALQAYLEVLRMEMAIFGVSAHVVEPGFFRTNVSSPQVLEHGMKQQWSHASDEVKKEYGEPYVTACAKAVEKHINWMCDGNGEGLGKVIDAYYHALTAKWPRQRYYPGRDIKLLLCFIWLPTSIMDMVQVYYMKFRKYPTPKACQ